MLLSVQKSAAYFPDGELPLHEEIQGIYDAKGRKSAVLLRNLGQVRAAFHQD